MKFFVRNKEMGHEPFVIAEVAQTHEGSLGLAMSFIDAVAKTGADAIKFQTHYAEEESTSRDNWRIKFSHQDISRYDYWKRMEFTPEQWKLLKNHAEQKGLVFLSTPFSIKAAKVLEDLVPFWKIGSGDTNFSPLIDYLKTSKKPIIFSSGMSDLEEIASLHAQLIKSEYPHAILHCTSEYPVKPENVGLNIISEMAQQFRCPVGFSSHIPDIATSIAAYCAGARIFEHHVTFSRDMFGPDVSSSLTFEELTQLVDKLKLIHKIWTSPVNKKEQVKSLSSLKTLFGRSIVATKDLPLGSELTVENIGYKKPGGGLAPSSYKQVLGKKLRSPKMKDELINEEDLIN